MALRGNLGDFSTTQLLNLIHLARKTGCLTVRTPLDSARLYFREGRLVHAHTASEDGDLTTTLVKAGKLSFDQGKIIAARPEADNDTQLGMYLVNAGHVSRDDVVQSVKRNMLEIVQVLFSWREGQFEFVPDAVPSDDRIVLPINLESVIIEGSRRLDENERLQDELPDLDNVVLRFASNADTGLRNVTLNVDEWRVISAVNGSNTIRMIAQASRVDDFQIRKIVYGLLQAGMVELVPLAARGVPSALAGGIPTAEKLPQVDLNVVERLIGRIKRM